MTGHDPARYKVALIGCGDIAKTGHLPAIMAHPRFELVALCDIRPERTARLASLSGRKLPTYEDYRALLDRERVDAVVLALHPEHSVPVVVECLRRGLAVLDEKPLACSLADGRRVAEEIEARRGVYQIGFCHRYNRWVQRVGDIARRIGTPALYCVRVYDERLDRGNPDHFARIQQILAASSAITHEASHVLDYFTSWNSSPWAQVQAMATRTEAEFHGPNLWSAQFQCADQSLLHVEIGWLLPDLPPSGAEIVGPRGRMALSYAGSGVYYAAGKAETFSVPPYRQEWARQLDVFAEAMDRGRATTATVQDGLRALEASIACETSLREGRTVEMGQAIQAP